MGDATAGYMWKRGESKSSTWQKRFFVFDPKFKTLGYSDKPGSKQKGNIDVGDMVVRPVSANTTKLPGHMTPELAFEIGPVDLQDAKGRTYWLAAESDADKKKWIGAMLPHCKIGSEQDDAPPAPVTTSTGGSSAGMCVLRRA
jgi:hypothetical protein